MTVLESSGGCLACAGVIVGVDDQGFEKGSRWHEKGVNPGGYGISLPKLSELIGRNELGIDNARHCAQSDIAHANLLVCISGSGLRNLFFKHS